MLWGKRQGVRGPDSRAWDLGPDVCFPRWGLGLGWMGAGERMPDSGCVEWAEGTAGIRGWEMGKEGLWKGAGGEREESQGHRLLPEGP